MFTTNSQCIQRLPGTKGKRRFNQDGNDISAPSKCIRGMSYKVDRKVSICYSPREDSVDPAPLTSRAVSRASYSAAKAITITSPTSNNSDFAKKGLPSTESFRIHGLVNSNTACFSNAVVQVLSSALTYHEVDVLLGKGDGRLSQLPSYDDLLAFDCSDLGYTGSKKLGDQANAIRARMAGDNKLSVAAYLGQLLYDLRTGIYQNSRLSVTRDNYVTPWVFQQAMAHGYGARDHHQFYDGREQQCASMYFTDLIDRLHAERPAIHKAFLINAEQYSQCGDCGHKGTKTAEKETSLNVIVRHTKGIKSVSDLINESLCSTLEGFKCPECRQLDTTTRHKTLTGLARELIVNIRRLMDGSNKNTATVNIQADEDIAIGDVKYRMRAMVRHKNIGFGGLSGHYTVFRKMGRHWYCIDDKDVNKVPMTKMKDSNRDGQSAMVLLEKLEG